MKKTSFTKKMDVKKEIGDAREQAIKGIGNQREALARALGVSVDAVIRTTGCELEFLVATKNKDAFERKNAEILVKRQMGNKDYYSKNADYMPEALQPGTWQRNLDRFRRYVSQHKGRLANHPVAGIDSFTLEPTEPKPFAEERYHPEIPTDPASRSHVIPQTYLQAEVVSIPFLDSKQAADWLAKVRHYLMDRLIKQDKEAHFDFRAEPTAVAWPNSMHMHYGLLICLDALLDSEKFSADQKKDLLKRNIRFYRENLEENEIENNNHEIELCKEIEAACNGIGSYEAISKNNTFSDVIKKIHVNMFSRRELEGDVAITDEADFELQETNALVGIEKKRIFIHDASHEPRLIEKKDRGTPRLVGVDEISQFGLLFLETLEQFKRECPLIFAPTENSYRRFRPEHHSAPHFNGLCARKTRGMNGCLMVRGGGRICHQRQVAGSPDRELLHIEDRSYCSRAIGHGNEAYANQQVMPYEVMEGIEAVFAQTALQYFDCPRSLSEAGLLQTYKACVTGLPHEKILEECVPENNRLPPDATRAASVFMKSKMAKEIYGRDRLEGMVARRKQIECMDEADFNPYSERHGPQIVRHNLKNVGVYIDENYRAAASVTL